MLFCILIPDQADIFNKYKERENAKYSNNTDC